ncbi:MAG: Ribonuclease Y [Candidatus Omnitrophica bacterium]|nr:Ribonuclease Y [Candidatus Omnitrophota bacterium]
MELDVLTLVIGLAVAGSAFAAGWLVRKSFAERLIRTAESKAREILVHAKREADDVLKRADKDSRTSTAKAQRDFENQIAERKRDLENLAKVLDHKEQVAGQKLSEADKRERETLYRLQEAENRDKASLEKQKALDRLADEQRAELARIAGVDRQEARRQLLGNMELEVRSDAGRMIRRIEEEAKAEADDKARKILGLAMMRCAAAHTVDSTVTVVQLPNEEMKGRIIGKDGRNIKTFETVTGVDVIIDDTPGAVVLSAFDGVRRETARLALEELIKDGRIQPARIEEVVQKTRRNMENVLKEEGEKAVQACQLTNVHPEIVKLLGRLRYRQSYGQNVLDHSIEVASILNAVAGEMGLDPALARRAGLLHDLGKAVSSDVEGPHALIGGELARRYGEHPDVVHAIEAHHEDIEMKSVWPMVTQAVDAVSAARPGARRESLENYLKRLKQLEEIADQHPGVEKSYAIQGGREVRVVVKPDRVAEEALPALAREIAKKIESSLDYPGQIKVIIIRETRYEDSAK